MRILLIVGMVLVSVWMAIWLLISFLAIPFAGDAACADAPGSAACGDAFTLAWLGLMAAELIAAIAAAVLWTRARTRPWGLLLGLVGTGGLALGFAQVYGLNL